MSTAEQAVWAHIAAVVLSRSILLPPHDESHCESQRESHRKSQDEELFRRDILPHIDHVRSCQESINRTIIANRERRWYGLVQWPGAQSRLDRDQALRFAKFSVIFAHNGRWKDAEELQLAMKAYTDRVLGPDHRSSRRVTLALAQTYWNQGRGDEAVELQDTVLQACIKWLGPDDYETLIAEELLGETRWQQGRYSDARVLQQHAVNGLTKLKGSGDEDTLTAMGRLGRTEAKKHITEAFRGLSNLLGPKHIKTLSVQEDLALLALQMKEDLSDPLEWLQHVLACRHEKLEKEHPYTLLAMTSLARVKTALGEHDEAEDLVRRGLSIAERNLGKCHIGYLMGKTLLGTILTNQSKYAEAESTLLEVVEKQRHLSACRGDFHPDRLGAMIELVSCYRLQGKLDESIQYCDEAIKGLQRISATQHPLERKMRAQKQDLMGMRLLRGD
jgi:tetratricopeptide (TPR) repeat protein